MVCVFSGATGSQLDTVVVQMWEVADGGQKEGVGSVTGKQGGRLESVCPKVCQHIQSW